MSTAHRVVYEQALCFASILIESLLFYNRNLGLLPRTSTSNDPLGPLVISDEDVSTITVGFRKIRATAPDARPSLLVNPFAAELAEHRAELVRLLTAPESRELGFVRLVNAFGLLENALDPFILAITPEWDARIGRLCGFLNNDSTRQRPTCAHLQMVLQNNLPAFDVHAIAILDRYLIKPGLLTLDGAQDSPLPTQIAQVPQHIVEISRLVGESLSNPDAALNWEQLFLQEDEKGRLRQALRREVQGHVGTARRLIILEGPPGCGRAAATRATANDFATQLELCEFGADVASQFERTIVSAFARAKVFGRFIAVRSDGALKGLATAWHRIFALTRSLDVPCFVFIRPDEELPSEGSLRFIRLAIPRLRPPERRRLWAERLRRAELIAETPVLDDIATRYDITPGRVSDLVFELQVRNQDTQIPAVRVRDVADSLREITSQRLRDLASLYVADFTLNDLILEQQVHERLEELIHRMRFRYAVLNGWNFGGKSMRGYGVSALFSGPPGTGKTAAAGAVARALDIDLYIVDLSRIMSKWVGETEQNLARVFDEAEASSVALLFDEADSLFGKRSSEVKSGADRYANITVNYLLQRIENYSGLAILTTNLESAIDTAFSRRITTRVYFKSPDEEHRIKLWNSILPAGASFDRGVDLSEIANKLEMPGARIHTALLRAAFRAAAAGRRNPVLNQTDIDWAAAAEYEDMGRLPALRAQAESYLSISAAPAPSPSAVAERLEPLSTEPPSAEPEDDNIDPAVQKRTWDERSKFPFPKFPPLNQRKK